MNKITTASLALGFTLLSYSTAFASSSDVRPYRPSNATPHAPMVHVEPTPYKGLVSHVVPGTHYERIYTEPSTINVSIWQRTWNGAEITGTYSQTVTVPFETYVKDVLPNEWMETWGDVSNGMASLYAGALAVKTYGWYHIINPKDSAHNAAVRNGTSCQVYTAGSSANATNCNAAVDTMADKVLGDTNGGLWETPYLSTASNDGYTMSQNGTFTDAKNGMSYTAIIDKWYSNQPFWAVGEVQLVPN